jgi:cleavage and polyadenylation specificity factor subunit 3
MFDCGVHMGLNGMNQLPFFDMIDPSTIDLILITQY